MDIEETKRIADKITNVVMKNGVPKVSIKEFEANYVTLKDYLSNEKDCNGKDILEKRYLFSWDNVPGNDSEILLRFLRDDLDIGWAENAEILKPDDGKTIRIFKDENAIEIMIDEGKEKATLKISDGRTYDLKVKKEYGKLNIYENELAKYIGGKEVEILPLIITKNVFFLPVLATLSMILKSIKNKLKNTSDKVELKFLIPKEVTKYSKYIGEPFKESYGYFFRDIKRNLDTIIDIDFSDTKSLLNLILMGLELEGVNIKDYVFKQKAYDIEEYIKEKGIKEDKEIEEWAKEKGDRIPANVHQLLKDVIFNKDYIIAEKLLRIVVNSLRQADNGKILILVVARPVKEEVIYDFFRDPIGKAEMEVNDNMPSNIIIASYTDIIEPNDPKILQEKAPSYLNILSKYLNLEEVVYAIDEYCYSMMMNEIGRKFKCEKIHDEIISEMKDDPVYRTLSDEEIRSAYRVRKEGIIGSIKLDLDNNELDKLVDDIQKLKIERQRKVLDAMNNGFLEVQSCILEHLKLLL